LVVSSAIEPVTVNPWNALVGAWLADVRRAQGRSAGDMVVAVPALKSDGFLRTIESAANPLPAGAALGLVHGVGLSFANAAMLVSSVRLLEERVSQTDNKDRPYDLEKMKLHVSELRRIWPEAGSVLDWLDQQLVKLERHGGSKEVIQQIKTSARDTIPILDRLLRSNPERAAPPGSGLPPLLADALGEMARKLSFISPQMTREQQLNWEADNNDRFTAVWGVVSGTTDVLATLETLDWSFLNNAHRPTLRIAVLAGPEEAYEIQEKWRAGFQAKLARSDVVERPNVRMHVRSYLHLDDEVGALLWFDQVGRGPVRDEISEEERRSRADGRFIRLRNCWIYELDNRREARTRVGIIDNFMESEPRFFSAALSEGHVDKWCRLLGKIHD
jgi:hypothetical protein